MAGLKEVRERISSVKSTQQITKAMKLVSAAKLKKASTNINQMRPYSQKLQEVMNKITANTDMSELSLDFNQKRAIDNLLIVVFSSDRGLCGGFNSNLIKLAKKLIAEKYADLNPKTQITILPIGKKAYDAFKNSGIRIVNDYNGLFQNFNFENTTKVSEYVINGFLQKDYDLVEVVYPQFKNAATQIFTSEVFLPIVDQAPAKKDDKSNELGFYMPTSDYIFEPNKRDLLIELLPKILKTNMFRYALENNASEHGARMVAMDSATNNAADLIRNLEIDYNKARQAAITNQIMEIVSGAAALEG